MLQKHFILEAYPGKLNRLMKEMLAVDASAQMRYGKMNRSKTMMPPDRQDFHQHILLWLLFLSAVCLGGCSVPATARRGSGRPVLSLFPDILRFRPPNVKWPIPCWPLPWNTKPYIP